MISSDLKLGIIGLGYVGLPLAMEFAKLRKVVGFDIDEKRIAQLRDDGIDSTLEVSAEEISAVVPNLQFTTDSSELKTCTCFIITVPTPVDSDQRPDLTPLIAASTLVGNVLKVGDVVIYESTVYPRLS